MLAAASLDSAKVMAFRHPLVGAPGVGFHGGPVILDPGHQHLRHTRYHQPVDWFDGHERVTARRPGDYVYAGPAYGHFGHVMSEMVHRLAPSRGTWPGRRLLFASTIGDTLYRSAADLPPFLQEVLGFFDVPPGDVEVLNADQVVDSLFVAQQGSDFGGGPWPGYLDLLAGLASRFLGKAPHLRHDKVYVSRSALPGGGGFLGEAYVEAVLEAAGFFIARPETMPLRQQMQLYSAARLLVFAEGSACHGVELLGSKALGTVLLLARRADHMDIFAKVLSPRAAAFLAIPPAPGTTSLFRTMKHATVGRMAVDALCAALRDCGIGEVTIDAGCYRQACEQDFMRYLDHVQRTAAPDLDPALVAAAQVAFLRP